MKKLSEFVRRNGRGVERWYFLVLGIVLLVVALALIPPREDGIAIMLATVGAGSLILAPLVGRAEGPLKLGPLSVGLRSRVIEAAEGASEASLKAILPLITKTGISVATIHSPASWDSKRLTDESLQFIRQKLQITVLAVRMRNDEESWIAGGMVSETELQNGQELLVGGPPGSVDYLRMLVETDNEEMWDRVR